MPAHLIITTLFEGTSPGSIWVDDLAHPTSAFMHSPEGDMLVGAADNAAFNAGFKAHVPSLNDAHLVIEYAGDGWPATLETLFDKRIVLEPRLNYQFERERPLIDWRAALPADVQIVTVDADFLARTDLNNMPAVLEWIERNWFSQQQALTLGFGRCLVQGDTVVSWCLADCVSGDRCEIGIQTDAHYRKRGYAALTVSATVEAAIQAGHPVIGWHCWEHNLGSRGVAEKVGFTRKHSYPAYVCLQNDAYYAIEVALMQARAGDHRTAITTYLTAGHDPWALFLAARSYGALGEVEPALDLIQQAMNAGWNAPDYLLADEFKPLHDSLGWAALLNDPRLKQG